MNRIDFKQLCVVTVIAMVAFACSKRPSATLKVDVDGLSNKEIVLSVLNYNKIEVVDTLTTNSKGHVKYKVEMVNNSPNFYYLSYNGRVIANLLLTPKEVVKITTDSIGKTKKVSGSEEAELYAKITDQINVSKKQFDSLTVQLLACEDIGDLEGAQRLKRELGKLYVKEKQSSIVSIISNPNSFTNITLLYREFNENFPLFGELTDGIYYMQVADSLKKLYPSSPYVKALEREAIEFSNTMEIRERVKKADEMLFPEIEMIDINSENKKLSDLLGRPFMLLFWSVSETSHKMLNAELEQLYKKYKGKNFEIYSVCVDTDKTYWAQVVKRFPWINVCDGKGTASPILSNYNVKDVPTMFLFDRNGSIVATDQFDMEKLDALIAQL